VNRKVVFGFGSGCSIPKASGICSGLFRWAEGLCLHMGEDIVI
jgi:hypothetical protein